MSSTKIIINKYGHHRVEIERANWKIRFYDYETSRYYERRVWFPINGSTIYVQLNNRFFDIVTETDGKYNPWACSEYIEII